MDMKEKETAVLKSIYEATEGLTGSYIFVYHNPKTFTNEHHHFGTTNETAMLRLIADGAFHEAIKLFHTMAQVVSDDEVTQKIKGFTKRAP